MQTAEDKKTTRPNQREEIISPSITQSKGSLKPINYLGSKLRMIDFIEETIIELAPEGTAVCDLFSGSGAVFKRISLSRQAISVDIQEYSRVICSALANPARVDAKSFIRTCKDSAYYRQLSHELSELCEYEESCITEAISGNPLPLCELIENGSLAKAAIENYDSYPAKLKKTLSKANKALSAFSTTHKKLASITQIYGGVYFSFRQTIAIDSILNSLDFLVDEQKDTILSALLGAVSNSVNTVGKQFAQPIQPRDTHGNPKKGLGMRVQKDRTIDPFVELEAFLEKYSKVPKSPYETTSICMDFSEALDQLPNNVSVVYADPPYTRDHYSRFYHILETICRQDQPTLSTTKKEGKLKVSRGLYRQDRHQSPFCIRSQAPNAFSEMFRKTSEMGACLVISYSPYSENQEEHPRVMTIEGIIDIAKKYFRDVFTKCPGSFAHSKLNNKRLNFATKTHGEVLIICKP